MSSARGSRREDGRPLRRSSLQRSKFLTGAPKLVDDSLVAHQLPESFLDGQLQVLADERAEVSGTGLTLSAAAGAPLPRHRDGISRDLLVAAHESEVFNLRLRHQNSVEWVAVMVG